MYKRQSVRSSASSASPVKPKKSINSLYLLRGKDPRPLSGTQAEEVSTIMGLHNFHNSFMLYNESEVARKINNWREALPWIQIHFAVKSSPSQPILEDMLAHNCGFDCASRAEIENVLNLGADRESIVYSNSVKDEAELKWAGKNGITLTTADSLDEL